MIVKRTQVRHVRQQEKFLITTLTSRISIKIADFQRMHPLGLAPLPAVVREMTLNP